ncbi:MAG TPA: hypothetical protein VEZ42_21155 [Pseudonocardia sp.]|nr:hypothetical protein [Pseudonocardia sp.]
MEPQEEHPAPQVPGETGPPAAHLVVDAANVVGSRPDGWWRDREGAARRLAGQLVAALTAGSGTLASAVGRDAELPLRVHLVLEGRAAAVPDLPTHPHLAVVRADTDGDSAIVALVTDLAGSDVQVVTADRELRGRVETAGAGTVGPAALLRALPG